MGRYLLRRILIAIPLLFIVSFVLFALMSSLGDPLAVFGECRGVACPKGEALEQMQRRMGLDKPMPLQYLTWLIGNDWQMIDIRGDGTLMQPGKRKGILRGDFGQSIITKQPTIKRIEERLPNTLVLMVPSFVFTVLLAVGIGIYSAIRQYSFIDNAVTSLTFFFYSMPIFFIALVSIYLFGLRFKQWGLPSLPIGGMYEPNQARVLSNLLPHMIMPSFCLIAISLAGYTRFIRSSMLEVLNADYIRTARAKGISERGTVMIHAFKNAALPLVTLIALNVPFLMAGAVVTERIFAWPGMGRLFIESLERSDYNVMMAILMFVSVLVVIFQLLADVAYTWLDPRIQYS